MSLFKHTNILRKDNIYPQFCFFIARKSSGKHLCQKLQFNSRKQSHFSLTIYNGATLSLSFIVHQPKGTLVT